MTSEQFELFCEFLDATIKLEIAKSKSHIKAVDESFYDNYATTYDLLKTSLVKPD